MSQQIQISGGAKVRDLQDVIIGTSGVLSSLAFNVANGVPKLDVNGKILVSQLPNSVMEYKGVWNAATNTPTLANGTGNQGDVYLCNVAGTTNFGAGPIAFVVGDQVIYSSVAEGSIWQRASGATGTVTSVALTESGDSLNITGSPITTSGTINIGFNGTNLQYVNGAGNLTTFPTLITSIGLSMPSAFSVANSPLTANGTIAVTGAGTTAQYIRGDGSLATFPTIATEAQRLITEVYNETGATLSKGTVVYINGGHGNLPTITKALATGDATSAQTYGIVQTDITNMNNGYVVVIGSLTDLDTSAYVEGTQLYLSSTTAGAWTSVKQYAPAHLVYVAIVTRSHPTQGVVEVMIQNGFEMDELHNVSAQSPLNNQGLFYNTSTSLWENKSIATALGYTPISLTSLSASSPLSYNNTTGAFSIQVANTSQNGYLSSTDWSTFNNKQNALTLTTTGTSGAATLVGATLNIPQYQGVLTNPVTGTGTTNTLPKFTSATTIGNSNITDTGSLITLGSNTNISSGALGIGTTSLTGYNLRISKSITGATSANGVFLDSTILSDVTSSAVGYTSFLSTQAATFTLGNLYHYYAVQNTFGAGSTILNQYGFLVASNLIGATNNYGFRGQIPSGANRWNIYMDGTASNYMAGSLGIGTTSLSLFGLRISKTITGGTIAYNQFNDGSVQSDVTSEAMYYSTNATTAASAFTLTNLFHYRARYNVFGAGSAVTNQYGYFVDSTLTAATNNYGFWGAIASGTNRWNLYMAGTADNHLGGKLTIGSATTSSNSIVYISRAITGSATANGIIQETNVASDVTTQAFANRTILGTAAAAFNLSILSHYIAGQGTIGAGSSVTTQVGYWAQSNMIGATNNYGFIGDIPSGTNRWNIYIQGTAANYMAGQLLIGTTTTSSFGLDVNSTARISGNLTIGQTSYLAGTYSLDVTTGGIAGISEVAKFAANGNGGAGRGAGIVISAPGSTNTVSVARLVGYQETASATANNASFAIQVANSSGTLTERVRVKTGGQMRFVPLAADPSGAEAGDVYYNSTISALKLYDGTVWRTITVI